MNDIKKPSFYYFRDYQNHEIDFIYHRGEIIIPIETTYSDKISTEEIRNFRKFFSLHNQIKYGIIFYLDKYKELNLDNKKIYALPYYLV